MLLQAQLPLDQGGLAGAGLFVSTKPDSARLHEQLLHVWQRRYGADKITSQNLLVAKVGEPAELLRLLRRDYRALIRSKSIKVMVIDSIASLITGLFESDEQDQKTSLLYAISRELKVLADDCRILIIVTNHVSDFMGHSGEVPKQQSLGGCWMSNGRPVIPSLGLFWANCISNRIILARTLRKVEFQLDPLPALDGDALEGFETASKRRKLSETPAGEVISTELRELRIQFSSFRSDEYRQAFVITDRGLVGVDAE
jgi:hypothetical protein